MWRLNLAEGRGKSIFAISDGTDREEGGVLYSVRTFSSDMKRLMVKKRPGMEKESLLQKDSGNGDKSVWDTVSGLFTSASSGASFLNMTQVPINHLISSHLHFQWTTRTYSASVR